MIEVWKDISEYEGYYQVSDQGRIKSLDRMVKQNNQYGFYIRCLRGRILKQGINKGGYLFCILSKNSKVKIFYIHRLVAEAFIDNLENKPEVNHKKGKENNRVDNLEWMTSSENTLDAFKNGLMSDRKGKNNGMSRTVIQMDRLGNIIKKFDCIMDVEKELKVFHSSIVKVCKGKQKTTGGFVWCYG